MSLQLLKSQDQNTGAFDNGLIQERKPIAFPGENPALEPFSTLFYWAYAWSHHGGLIAEHPHRGFEICTFVLEGDIEHYDNQTRNWISLEAGDVQIIRSGSGITHAEKIKAGGKIFQIWFDPNLEQSLGKAPSYEDFRADAFAVAEGEGLKIRTLVGYGSPLRMDTPVRIRRVEVQAGKRMLSLTDGHKAGIFLIDGTGQIQGESVNKGDFVVVADEHELVFDAAEKADLFVVEVPVPAPYDTYAESQG